MFTDNTNSSYEETPKQDGLDTQKASCEIRQDNLGGEQEQVLALELFRLVADRDDAEAQFILGSMYFGGLGRKEDQSRENALYFYQEAAKQGHVNAQYFLGKMYYEGFGVGKDLSEAYNWYKEAAYQGHACSIFIR